MKLAGVVLNGESATDIVAAAEDFDVTVEQMVYIMAVRQRLADHFGLDATFMQMLVWFGNRTEDPDEDTVEEAAQKAHDALCPEMA